MKLNAFSATEPDDAPIGLCFEPTMAKANHSCLPNAFVSFDGRCVSLKALKPIATGKELFISYVGQYLPLGGSYYFFHFLPANNILFESSDVPDAGLYRIHAITFMRKLRSV